MKNERIYNKAHCLTAALIVMLLFVCLGVYSSAGAYTERAAVVSSDGEKVSVRSGPGTTCDRVASLADKTRVTIIGEAMASDGSKWYEIRYITAEATATGFMHSTYLIYEDYSGLDEAEKKTFEELLAEFPESYKTQLLILHDMYPQWKFVAMKTGLQWEDVLAAESDGWISLVSTNAISSWKSTEGDAYDWNTSTWKPMDGAKWVTASRDIVAYYLDPRNYMDGSMIFAFITHEYDEAEQNIDGVRSVIGKSFMATDFTENGTTYSYAQVLMDAAKTYGVSPYVLAAMIRIEIGYNGDSASISGVEPGYENLYNYYNVGSYATANMTANQRGLWYAAGAGEGNTSYGRPWDSRYKSLMGGAEYYATGYVARGQNTLYLKRFNVTPNNTYSHQYMTNIQGAASEANVYSLAYNAEAKQQNLLFYIPVYENMPETACAKPTKTGSPNNKLGSITLDGAELADFHMDTTAYRIEVGSEVDKVLLGAVAKDQTAQLSGIGEVPLIVGENHFTINCTAQNGDVRGYHLTIVRAVSADADLGALTLSAGKLTPAFESGVYDYSVLLEEGVTELNVTAAAKSKQAVVEVSGAGPLTAANSIITIKVTAGDGAAVKEYRIHAAKVIPNPEVTVTSESYKVNENKTITGISEFPVTPADFAAKLAITGGSVKLFNADGVTEAAAVGTGTKVYVYDANNVTCAIYTVVIYGDVSGDGVIDALDLMMLRQYLKGKVQLSDAYLEAANISHDQVIDALDLMMQRQYLKNRWVIEQ